MRDRKTDRNDTIKQNNRLSTCVKECHNTLTADGYPHSSDFHLKPTVHSHKNAQQPTAPNKNTYLEKGKHNRNDADGDVRGLNLLHHEGKARLLKRVGHEEGVRTRLRSETRHGRAGGANGAGQVVNLMR
jgi:hypothetical protein